MNDRRSADTPRSPRVGLAAFADYLSATPGGRLDCVRRQIATYSGDYRPGAAFYKDFIDSLIDGRRNGSDELSLQRVVSAQRVPARAQHYDDLRRHWLNMTTAHLPLIAVSRTDWSVEHLTVGIAPELGLQRRDGGVLVVKLWPYANQPSDDAVRAVHRLLSTRMDALRPGGTAALLDIRREKTHVLGRRPFKKGFDAMLANEANGMGRLWETLAAIA